VSYPDLLFVPYQDTLDLLSVDDAMRVCEEVYRMRVKGAVLHSKPPSFKLDVGEEFNNHWHVKCAMIKDVPTTGVRLYNYYDDGQKNTIGSLDHAAYVFLSDPNTGQALGIVDEHWTYAIRSTAAATLACKWLGPAQPRVLGLVGVGVMGVNSLRCLATLYKFDEIRCTSRRKETRESFAKRWASELNVPIKPCETVEEVVRGADLVVGGTTSSEIVAREEWLKPGCTFISLARRELDPAGWARMDKVVLDSWEMNMLMPVFKSIVEAGMFKRELMHAEIQEVVTGVKSGRTKPDERILIHTTGLVEHDLALAHFVLRKAKEAGRGIWLPAARDSSDA
jgi:alanine dehydrogenase